MTWRLTFWFWINSVAARTEGKCGYHLVFAVLNIDITLGVEGSKWLM